MVHHGKVLVNPSSTIILSHTTLHVYHRLILEKLSSYDQVASKDIQYLEIALDQFFLGQDQATSDEPS
jgi:two-component sensor histidine kinase